MAKPQSPAVYKSNALIEASYRLTPAEQRIILACIAQVRRDAPITDDKMYSVSAAQIAALTGTASNATYEELEKAALRLKRREVWIKEHPNGRGPRKTLITGWVQSVAYVESEGRIELRFTKDMLPYLSQLTEQFTRYALSDVAKMTSAHAIRLYELLCQWRDSGERVVALDWLRQALQLEERYGNIRDLKRRVVEPAVEQINEHSPLWVKWDQRKTGRRVTHLVFTFGEKDRQPAKKPRKPRKRKAEQAATAGSIYGIPRAVIERKAKPGESYEDAALRLLNEAHRAKADTAS
ncbi:replication initiation protein [Marichromatium sp. AB32]|uniref:replication initiation protein n=1 Tax=Marichromatium sp. AB32 TaxID=2483363 RepID=UPI000F3EE945|nr:replication initiation protein [Marichromatium sp. AB32]RNE88345.1 RepB family plasmid replication initiator protein [Marichromatium sp. AB32]